MIKEVMISLLFLLLTTACGTTVEIANDEAIPQNAVREHDASNESTNSKSIVQPKLGNAIEVFYHVLW